MAATDNEEYDVKAVRGYRNNIARSREEFLIEWADFGEEDNSWVQAKDLSAESLEVARKYQEKFDNLPPPSIDYRRQARQLLVNEFQRVSCSAIDVILRMCRCNFTRSFHYISWINHQRTNNEDGACQYDLFPRHVKVFVKKNRQKTPLEVTDETLLDEINDIPALNVKVGTTAKQGVTTPKKLLEGAIDLMAIRSSEPVIDLTADSSEDEEEKEEEKEIECGCCFGDYPVSALKQCAAGENHYVCRDCIQRYVSEQLDGNGSTEFKCIVSAECTCKYSLAFLDQVLSPTLKKRANEMVTRDEINKAGGAWQCPTCAHMGFVDGKPKWIHCPECNVMYCTSCNSNHTGLTCEEFQRRQTIGKDPRLLAAEAMSRACTRSCPHCGQDYVKSDGCNKIRCKCGGLSCYLCGEKVADYTHFCNKMGCACDKCELWTNGDAMKRIDQEKRQVAGRKVLLEQGITDGEEIAAILRSLDDEEEEQVVAAAAVQRGRGGAGNQRIAADADGGIRNLLDELRAQHGLYALNRPPPQQGAVFGAPHAGFAFGAAPNRRGAAPDPPPAAAAAAARPNQPPQFGLPQVDPAPQQMFVFGAAAAAPPQRGAPQAQVAGAREEAGAGNLPQMLFAFGAAPNRRAVAPDPPPAAARPNQPPQFRRPQVDPAPQQRFVFRAAAAAPPQRGAPQAQGAAGGNAPQGFAFGTAPNRRAEAFDPPAAAARPNHEQAFHFPRFNAEEARVQHNDNVNRLAEDFGAMGLGLGQHDANEGPGRRHDAGAGIIARGERLLPRFLRLINSAHSAAREGREEFMNNVLDQARALAERPDARFTHGIEMHYYESNARRARQRLQRNRG